MSGLHRMQLLYQTRDAKFDFAARRKTRLGELMRKARDSGMRLDDEDGDDDYDPVWENAMQAAVDIDDYNVSRDTRSSRDAKNIISEAEDGGFYLVKNSPSREIQARFGQRVRIGDEDDMINANIASKNLLHEKNSLIKRRLKAVEEKHRNTPNLRRPSDRIAHAICTTLKEEAERAQELYERLSRKSSRSSPWSSLRPYQRLCFSLVIKHTLNDEQTRTIQQGRKRDVTDWYEVPAT
ncbi:hypothetical protein B0H13DRAFT_2328385 [Mycena leptocephala]|nr:hypothetical protein B0H13DRAFT_2328385 [Mycena leptocephala]